MISLVPFTEKDFETLIGWIDSEDLLLTIAGSYFSFPLTSAQLHQYLADAKSHAMSVVDMGTGTVIGHAELINRGDGLFNIDKLIIGDQNQRGKGTGQAVMQQLCTYAFEKLHAVAVELNVFSWNAAAIRCYEKVGFTINAGKTTSFPIRDTVWTALNMRLEKRGLKR